MNKKTFIAGYWQQRPENIDITAKKIQIFLDNLKKIDELIFTFKLKAYSKKKAMENSFIISHSFILDELRKRRKKSEINEDNFCDIGFSFSAFNEIGETSAVIGCTIGASNTYINNVCYLDIKGKQLDEQQRLIIVNLIKEIFEPETMKIDW